MLGAKKNRRERQEEQRILQSTLKLAKAQRQDDKIAAKNDLVLAKAAVLEDESDWKGTLMKALPWVAGAAVVVMFLMKKKGR